MKSGKRVWKCELSTVDTAFLLAGMLAAAAYFVNGTAEEREIRTLADELYLRADWNWAQNGGVTVTHGWNPESGFLPYRWEGYDEALFLYLLGLGSPTHPLPKESYAQWTSTYEWRKIYDHEFLYSGPLFTHQISHIWIDFRGIQDDYMRGKSIDYFENSRRATYVQRQYAIDNPARIRWLRRKLLGHHRQRWPGPSDTHHQGSQAAILWLRSARRARRPRRRKHRPLGGGCLTPFCAGNRAAGASIFRELEACARKILTASKPPSMPRFADRSDPSAILGFPVPFWSQPGADRPDDREFSLRPALASDATMSLFVTGLRRAGFAGGWLGDKPPKS